MGAYLSHPITDKESVDEENELLSYGACSMQGWRMSQEDAHNSILNYDNNSSLFAVYDGHGGSEVANYCAQQLPVFLRLHKQYALGNYERAMREAFVDFDGTLITEPVIEELRQLMPPEKRDFDTGDEDEDDVEDEAENLAELCQEGNMPLAELLEKYKEVRSKIAAAAGGGAGGSASESNGAASAPAGASSSGTSAGGRAGRRTTHTAARAGGSSSPEPAGTNGIGAGGSNGTARPPGGEAEISFEFDSDDSDDEEYEKRANGKKSDSDDSDSDEDVNGSVGQSQESDEGDEEDEVEGDGDDEVENDHDADDNFLNGMMEGPGSSSGCTAVVALLVQRELYVANAGDSRCVVCRVDKALDMSFDHKPEDVAERARIENAGGRVTEDGRVNGGLNLSRALGDHAYKTNELLKADEQMISPLPDVKHITITPEDEFMIIACDGIWNFMSSQEVIDFVRVRINDGREKLSSICEELFTNCLAPNTMGDGTGCDNMTAVIVRFKPALYQRPALVRKKRTAASHEDEKAKRIKTEDAAAVKADEAQATTTTAAEAAAADVAVAADATEAVAADVAVAADAAEAAAVDVAVAADAAEAAAVDVADAADVAAPSDSTAV